MKLMTWDLSGLNARKKRGELEVFTRGDFDAVFFQKPKLKRERSEKLLGDGYLQYWNVNDEELCTYRNTVTLVREAPLSVQYGMGTEKKPDTVRVTTLEYEEFYLVNFSTPSGALGKVLDKLRWMAKLNDYAAALQRKKPVIMGGAMLVCLEDDDLEDPRYCARQPGYLPEEREKLRDLLGQGYVDAYRYTHPHGKAYTYWKTRVMKEKDFGFRFSSFYVTEALASRIVSVEVLEGAVAVYGCPVLMELDI